MELTESIESINRQLQDQYGLDTSTNQPIFRVVFSNGLLEKRLMTHTDTGIELLTPEFREVPKYTWFKDRYVLERLVVVPLQNAGELTSKLSYEPLWIFETQLGKYLPPRFDAAKLIIDTMYAAMGKKSLRKYVDEEAQNPVEVRNARIKKLQDEMFGNETSIGDSLAHKTGVVVPHPMKGSIS